MAVCFWYLVKSDLFSVCYFTSIHWTSHFLQGNRNVHTAMHNWYNNKKGMSLTSNCEKPNNWPTSRDRSSFHKKYSTGMQFCVGWMVGRRFSGILYTRHVKIQIRSKRPVCIARCNQPCYKNRGGERGVAY